MLGKMEEKGGRNNFVEKELMELGNPKMQEEVSMRTKLNETLSAKAGIQAIQNMEAQQKS